MSLFRRKTSGEDETSLDEAPENSHDPGLPGPESRDASKPLQEPSLSASAPDKSDNPGGTMSANKAPSAGFVPEIPRRTIDLPGAPGRRQSGGQRAAGEGEGKRLVVGREISLSGEITACESLIVEGKVEATLENSESLEVSEGGVFIGTVVINDAVIAGTFEGTMTAREKLTVKSTGRITGNVKFHQLEVELGGEIDGEVRPISQTPKTDEASD